MALAITPTYSLTPSSEKKALSTNYLTSFDYATQFLPEVDSKEFNRYGNRTISGLLNKLSAEYAYSSDLVKWSEEGRLHTAYTGVARTVNVFDKVAHVFRVNETIIVSDAVGVEAKAIITAITADTFTAVPYISWGTLASTGLNVFVYGSEFKKGTNGMQGSLEAQTQIFENSGITMKELYEVNGSDMAQIGWIEVSDNSTGQKGYLWYLKSKSDTVLRFADKLEMSVVEGVKATNGALAGIAKGTEGFFASIQSRGNIFDGKMTLRSDFDSVVDRLNKQGAIEENTMHLSTAQDRAIDDMLAAQNAHFSGGVNWGAFQNSEKMALDLGFQGFKRSGFNFYKNTWKYLNDASTRGLGGLVHGVIAPSGTKSVYDEMLGQSVKLPFLHIKYRKSATEDRKYKTWVTGSAGGASTSDLDAMQCHFLSERMLCTLGANNFVQIKG